jgi:uncharacterized protein
MAPMSPDGDIKRPPPVLTDDNRFFWEAARDSRLVAQSCSDCGRHRHPPRPMCPSCGSVLWHETALSGKGTLYSFSILHHPKSPQFDYPVIAALVDLEEGVRLVTNIVDVESDLLQIGMALEVRFVDTLEEMKVPVFCPDPETR